MRIALLGGKHYVPVLTIEDGCEPELLVFHEEFFLRAPHLDEITGVLSFRVATLEKITWPDEDTASKETDH